MHACYKCREGVRGDKGIHLKNFEFRISNLKLYIFCILCSVFCALDAQAGQRNTERFVYSVYWSGFKAGDAILEIDTTTDGITITSRAMSSPFISIFYKVDDLTQSKLYNDGYPSTYILNIREGKYRRDTVTNFGTKSNNSSHKIIYNDRLKNETLEFNSEKRVFDPLSGFYEIRRRQLIIGRSEYIDIFDNKKLYNTEVQILGRERITVPAGEFNTIVVKPLLKSEGIFMKKGDIYIWLTDDEKKIPIMLKSKVKVGSFVAKLEEGVY